MAFCDWLGIYQQHDGGLPPLNSGLVASFDASAIKEFYDPLTGEIRLAFDTQNIEWQSYRKFEHVGSYDTKIRIRCDGNTVFFDGNVSRFGRPDNVFGHSVMDCVIRANHILAHFGLPPFSHQRNQPSRGDSYLPCGAIITRINLTENYQAGSNTKLNKIIQYMAGQDAGRRASVKQYGLNGVTWNEGSQFWYMKLYNKFESLGDHCSEKLSKWVEETGIARHEISLKSRYLTQHGLRHIGSWIDSEGHNMENIVYGRFTEVLTRGTATQTPLEDIPKKLGHLALAWRGGKDLWGDPSYCKSTKRAWRKALLAYGIDIKQSSNVHRLPIRLEVLTLSPVQAPDWYWKEQAA